MSPALVTWDVCGIWECPQEAVQLVLCNQLALVPVMLCAGGALKRMELDALGSPLSLERLELAAGALWQGHPPCAGLFCLSQSICTKLIWLLKK